MTHRVLYLSGALRGHHVESHRPEIRITRPVTACLPIMHSKWKFLVQGPDSLRDRHYYAPNNPAIVGMYPACGLHRSRGPNVYTVQH